MTVGYCKPMLQNTHTVLLPLQISETCRMILIFQVLLNVLFQDVLAGYSQITAGPVKPTQGTETIKWCNKRKS